MYNQDGHQDLVPMANRKRTKSPPRFEQNQQKSVDFPPDRKGNQSELYNADNWLERQSVMMAQTSPSEVKKKTTKFHKKMRGYTFNLKQSSVEIVLNQSKDLEQLEEGVQQWPLSDEIVNDQMVKTVSPNH